MAYSCHQLPRSARLKSINIKSKVVYSSPKSTPFPDPLSGSHG